MSPHHPESTHAEVSRTLVNALKLGGSLVMTLVIGFGVRVALRRYLGPSVMGPLNFAEAFASTAFVVVGLGLDTHIRNVVPVRPQAASEFLGTFFVTRALLGLLVVFGMAGVLQLMGVAPESRKLVWVYAAAQVMQSLNVTFVALLQSARTIDGLSVLNVVAKLLWAVGFVATMLFGWPLYCIPLTVLASEAVKALVSWWLVRRHLQVKLHVDFGQLRPVLKSSFPFYVNVVALEVVNRFGVNALEVRSTQHEIGLYGAASELAQMTFILAPMLFGVVTPLFARTKAKGDQEYGEMLRRTLELVLVVAFPAALFMALGSELWVSLILGPQYAASALALRILAASLVLSYVAVICALALNVGGGAWTVTTTSLLSMVLNPVLVLGLVGFGNAWGEGGAGAACAVATITTELVVVGLMFWRMGRMALDGRLVRRTLLTLGVCAVLSALDFFVFAPLAPALRLLVEVPLYLVLVLVTRALPVRETLAFVKTVRAMRSQPPPTAPAAAS